MKKFIKYMFGMILFLGFTNVVSAEQLFKCDYSINFKGFGAAQDKDLHFELIVGDSEKNSSISSFDSYSGSETLGGLYITTQSGLVKTLYTNAIENNTCPSVSFTFDGNSNIQMSATGNFSEEYLVKTISGKFSSNKVEEAKEKIICTRTKNLRNESNVDVSFTFYELNGKKYFKASGTNTDNASVSEASGVVSVGSYTFNMTSDFIDKIYSSESACKNTKTYLRCFNGASERVELSLTKPSDVENCSYSVNDAPGDDGSDAVNVEEPTHSTWTKTDGETLKLAKKIYEMVKIIVPVLIIILSIVDFLKVVLLSDDKNYKAAWSKFIKRIVIGIIFFVVPALIALLLNIGGLGESGILNVFA